MIKHNFFAASMLLYALFSNPAQTNEQVKFFDLPAQRLSNSLLEFALQADISLYLKPTDLHGKRAPAIVGPYKVNKALDRLLSGSELSYIHNSITDSYQIEAENPTVEPETTDKELDPQPSLDEVLVTGVTYPNRYHTLRHSRNHSGVSSFDSVRMHSTLTETLMDDRNSSEVREILNFSSGITLGDGLGDTNDDFYIRGFPRHSMYIDSYRLESSTGIRFLSDHIEQTEILKGPSSLYYGQGQPGGVVNLVRKKPNAKPFLLAEQSMGERIVKSSIDLNSHFKNTVGSRSIFSYSESKPNEKLNNLKQLLVYESLDFDWNKIEFSVGIEWQQESLEKIKDEQALNAYLNLFPGATLDEVLHQKNNNYKADFFLGSLNTHYSLNNDWILKGSIHWQEEKRDGIRTNIDQARFSNLLIKPEELGNDYLLLMPGGEMAIPIVIIDGHRAEQNWRYRLSPLRTIYDEESYETGLFAALDLEGSIQFAGFAHHLSLGMDGKRQDTYQAITIEVREPYAGITWSAQEFALQLPNIAKSALFDSQLGRLEEQQERRVYDEFGAYISDTVEVGTNSHISAGIRYTRALAEFENIKDNRYEYPDIVSEFTGQFGFSHAVSEKTSLFANYSESLRANYFQYMGAPEDLLPEYGTQVELGAKLSGFNNKLLSNIAVYRIEKQNIYSKSLQFYIDAQIRSQRPLHNQVSEGLDLDLSLELHTNTQVILAASILNSRISSGEFKYNQPALVADKTASLLLRQDLTSNFAAQVSVQYVGDRFGDEANLIELGDYQLINLGLSYSPDILPNSEWHFTVKNVLDETYYSTLLAGARINYGSPRSAYATIKYQFF